MIKVYTTPTCPWCHVLMEWLDKQNIKYQEIDAREVPGITTVPVTEINGERIVGFDRPALKTAISKLSLSQEAEDELKAA